MVGKVITALAALAGLRVVVGAAAVVADAALADLDPEVQTYGCGCRMALCPSHGAALERSRRQLEALLESAQ